MPQPSLEVLLVDTLRVGFSSTPGGRRRENQYPDDPSIPRADKLVTKSLKSLGRKKAHISYILLSSFSVPKVTFALQPVAVGETRLVSEK